MTGHLIIGEAHDNVVASRTDAEVTASVLNLVRLGRRRLSVAPAAGRAPQSDDLAEPRALSHGPRAAQDDLVIRTDPRSITVRRVRPSVERQVNTGRRDCHTAYGNSRLRLFIRFRRELIPLRTMGR